MSSIDESDFITWINSLMATRLMIPIDLYFLRDSFNRTGIDKMLNITPTKLEELMEFIIDDVELPDEDYDELNKDAVEVYGLLHARFLLTERGLNQVRDLYENGEYGQCPRHACDGQNVLPIDAQLPPPEPNHVQIYCPKCEEIYRIGEKTKSPISGAFFGADLPQTFFMAFPELRPKRSVHKAKCVTK
uniref:Casein kinase II subunit beta n=1 Tax=Panagrellus redivivus TaxID=6233 RepID=A0A7E4ZXP0_PANRE